MSDYYDRSGKPMDAAPWAKAMNSERHVADDRVGEVRVSTVWLGLDHQWRFGPPLIFETMVFGGPLDGEMDRYTTEREAKAGHAAMLARVIAAAKPEAEER